MQANITKRLVSLDVLRGFDMFWIIGGGSLICALADVTKWDWLRVVSEQMEHVKWNGFHFEDLIFPLFMFISGVAIHYSVTAKTKQGSSQSSLLKKAAKRGILLFSLGILYNGCLQRGFGTIRVPSVLGQIGLAYFFASTVVIYFRQVKTRFIWIAGIFAFIAILQLLVPVPGYGAGVLDKVGGINAWLDRMVLGGLLHDKTYDPEGLLCIISATTVTLMGTIAGALLSSETYTPQRKTIILAVAGLLLVIVALCISPFYPIIKAAATVPFDLLTAGISSILLSIFYFLIDVKKSSTVVGSKIVFFFKVIGMNSITIYLGRKIIDFEKASTFFLGWLKEPLGEWTILLGMLALEWMMLHYLYKNRIFLKV
jgi:predicted acyltransferase